MKKLLLRNLVTALVLTQASTPAFAELPKDAKVEANHFKYQARIWNLNSPQGGGENSLENPLVTVVYDPTQKAYVTNGTLSFRESKAKTFFTAFEAESKLQVSIRNKDQGNFAMAYPADSAHPHACELQNFDDGTDTWLVAFENLDATAMARGRCEDRIRYNLEPNESSATTAENKLERLRVGPRKISPLIDNSLKIPLHSLNVTHDGKRCLLSPNDVGPALREYLRMQFDFHQEEQDKLTAWNTDETGENRFDRCMKNFSDAHFNIDVLFEKNTDEFVEVPKGWPRAGEVADPETLKQGFEIPCDLSGIRLRSLDTTGLFTHLRQSLIGKPLPGIQTKELAGMDTTAALNSAHSSNYWQSMGLGATLFGHRRYVVVPRKSYDDLCGNPNAQFKYATQFMKDIETGQSIGQAAGLVTIVAGGVEAGIAKFASKEIAAAATESLIATEGVPTFEVLSATAEGLSKNSKLMGVAAGVAVVDAALLLNSLRPKLLPQVRVVPILIAPSAAELAKLKGAGQDQKKADPKNKEKNADKKANQGEKQKLDSAKARAELAKNEKKALAEKTGAIRSSEGKICYDPALVKDPNLTREISFGCGSTKYAYAETSSQSIVRNVYGTVSVEVAMTKESQIVSVRIVSSDLKNLHEEKIAISPDVSAFVLGKLRSTPFVPALVNGKPVDSAHLFTFMIPKQTQVKK